ncbi:MAG: PH domain-containing protein [Propionibacteriaceae bacterium]|nr:PH domain-containing protein [Propionibacteriaceae bacterium]
MTDPVDDPDARGDEGRTPPFPEGEVPPVPADEVAPVPADQVPALAEDVPAATEKLTERPHPLTPLIRGWIVILALAFGLGRELLNSVTEDRPLPPIAFLVGGFGVVVLIAVVIGFLSWLTTRFVIDADELRLESGILLRRSQRVAFDKVASIDVLQPLAARIFGLAELEIDIGSASRTKLRYLSRARAYSLRDYLLSRAHGHQAEIGEVATSLIELSDLQQDDEVLLRLSPQRIVLGAVTSNEFIVLVATILVTIGVVAAAFAWLPPEFTGGDRRTGFLGVSVAVIAIAVSGLSGVVGFVTRRITGQFNFTLSRRPSGLRISRGLTSLTSQSVPPRRIQAVQLTQSVLWRRPGWYRVEIDVLGQHLRNEDDTRASTSSVLLPIAHLEEVRMVLAQLWPDADFTTVGLRPAPFRARWLHPITAPFLGFGHDEQLVVSRHGWLERRWQLVPHARVQSVRISQGPVSRRLGLANLAFHTAGSRLHARARGLDATHVRQWQAELIELAQAHRPDITVPVIRPGQSGEPSGTVPVGSAGTHADGPDAFRADQADDTISSTE